MRRASVGRYPGPMTLSILLVIFAVGCGLPNRPNSLSDSSPSPTLPSPIVPSERVVVPTLLAIEDGFLIVHPLRGQSFAEFPYEPRFRLRETTGSTAVTIDNIAVGYGGGFDNTGPSCWVSPLKVPAGGTLDVFYTDEGQRWLGYCAVWSGGPIETPTLDVVVSFTADDGRTGTVRTVITRK